jgi:hypothetical protein
MFLSEGKLATIPALAIIIATKYLSEWDLALEKKFRTEDCRGLKRRRQRKADSVVAAVYDRRSPSYALTKTVLLVFRLQRCLCAACLF